MRLPKRKTSNKKLVISIITIAVLVLIGGYTAVAHHFDWWPFATKTPAEQIKTGASIKNQAQQNQSNNTSGSKSNSNSNGSVGSTPVPTPTPGQNGGKSTVPVTITSANQSSGSLEIRTLIGAVTNGTCTLTLTGPGSTYTATADTQSLPSSSTCDGFSVPVAKLAPGAWTITINFESDSLQGSATQGVTIQ